METSNQTEPVLAIEPVLITGGSGFIGTHLINALLARGVPVWNLDIRAPAFPGHRAHWIEGDLTNLATVQSLLTNLRPSRIYNLAAHARLKGSANDMRVNVEGVATLLAAAHGNPLLVQASTMVVAGAATGNFDPTAYEPQYGLYAQSKVEAEKLLRASSNTRWVIVRPSVIWGPLHPTFGKEIWRYIRLGLYMHPSGSDAVRSYGYVANVVDQLLRIGEVEPARVVGATLYAGDEPMPFTRWLNAFSLALAGNPIRPVPLRLLQAAAEVGEISGKLGVPAPIDLARLKRMTTDFAVPMQPTFDLLGRPVISLDEGVRQTVAWLNGKWPVPVGAGP